MEFALKAEGFTLTLSPRIFEDETQYPCNTVLEADVVSHTFSGRANMDIDVQDLAGFACDMCGIYESLRGTARIAEPYGRMYLEFQGDGRGHIRVGGFLCDTEHSFEFENAVDQTCLRGFCHELKTALEAYLPK